MLTVDTCEEKLQVDPPEHPVMLQSCVPEFVCSITPQLPEPPLTLILHVPPTSTSIVELAVRVPDGNVRTVRAGAVMVLLQLFPHVAVPVEVAVDVPYVQFGPA